MRRALASFVDAASDMSIVGEARTGAIAVLLHSQLKPDVVVVSLPMEQNDGVDAIRLIRESDPDARVLALTTSVSASSTVMALRAGAQGFVMRNEEPGILLDRIRDVHRGETVLSKSATLDLIAFVLATPDKVSFDELPPGERLSDLELSVVRLLAEGMSNTEIAKTLYLSEATVKMRFAKIMGKWGVRTRVHVLIRAVRVGLVGFGDSPQSIALDDQHELHVAVTASQ